MPRRYHLVERHLHTGFAATLHARCGPAACTARHCKSLEYRQLQSVRNAESPAQGGALELHAACSAGGARDVSDALPRALCRARLAAAPR